MTVPAKTEQDSKMYGIWADEVALTIKGAVEPACVQVPELIGKARMDSYTCAQ